MRHEIIEKYLEELLGIAVTLKPWAGVAALPYFLHDEYEFASIELLGVHYVLMLARDKAASAGKVRKHLDTLMEKSGAVGIYVVEKLISFERKRLIEQHVPFIVPGNQLYLPDLGINLREYFLQRRETADKGLSPSTQALLIAALLKPWQAEVHPAELGEGLGYTTMTLSRAVRELKDAGLAEVVVVGRERWLRFEDDAQTTWRKALPLLRDPVKKSVWAIPVGEVCEAARLAGESALAQSTLLAEPTQPIYALSGEQWKRAQQSGMHALPSPEPSACLWQIWWYDPNINSVAGAVDPLSLMLSLRNEPDERVQQALTELQKGWL